MSASLRELLSKGKLVAAPGAFDALMAKLVEEAGFQAAYMSGYCTAATRLGLPDLGLLTMGEMLSTLSDLSSSVGIPIIADADTGYGNAINVTRTVREYERAGAAALHIEDQLWPKRCGHMNGKQVIPVDEMVSKVKAAVDARSSQELVVIARTDSLAVEGLDGAIARCLAYAKAGADVVFVDGQRSMEEIEQVPKRCAGLPCLINLGPLTPPLSASDLEAMGYAIAIYPGATLGPAVTAVRASLRDLAETGQPREGGDAEFLQMWAALNGLLGAPEYLALEEKYRA